jgi:hypothetical protein
LKDSLSQAEHIFDNYDKSEKMPNLFRVTDTFFNSLSEYRQPEKPVIENGYQTRVSLYKLQKSEVFGLEDF